MLHKLINTLLVSLLLSGCASQPNQEELPLGLEVSEVRGNRRTAVMKQNVLHLAQVYDLTPFLYSKKIEITSEAQSKAFPVITLNARFSEKPNKILSQWLHEEMHWWVRQHPEQMKAAIRELNKVWPKVPPEGRVKSATATYSHLIICWLEQEALTFYLGKTNARNILREFIKKDRIYPWSNSQVLNQGHVIKKVVHRHKLLPPPLK